MTMTLLISPGFQKLYVDKQSDWENIGCRTTRALFGTYMCD